MPRPTGPASWPTGWRPPSRASRVLHRPGKEGLGRAYIDGFARRARRRRRPRRPDGRRLVALARLPAGPHGAPSMAAPTSSSARATRAAAACATGASCGASSRAAARSSRASCWACGPHDLTGGFKAWRRATLESIDWGRVHSGGYVFQIETTYLASRAGARVAEVPIVFEDREVGSSKMSKSHHPGGARRSCCSCAGTSCAGVARGPRS